ncbi:VOC family protein [Salibacterium salarium]|uniref:VOC family protein n=1 Tax=Salibacterium salarium TaxID=284579 RepID=A0A3R9QGP9_9BACI|nr:VOC family protein [Salibacterium salarium]RSL30136.1 VOC family protein [Salibacterium salarium]
MKIESLDHIVLTVNDIDKTIMFYTEILGMEVRTFGNNRKGLSFGKQQLNLHKIDEEVNPRACKPVPGSADLCLITSTPLKEVQNHLLEIGVEIETGPIMRAGALGEMMSVYFRDPDKNLVEVSNYNS